MRAMKSDKVSLETMIRFEVCIKYSVSYRCSLVKIERPVKILVFADHIAEEIKGNPEKNGIFY